MLRVFDREGVAPHRAFAPGESVEWVSGNLMHKQDVRTAVGGADAVVHLVSTTLPKKSNEDPVFDVQSNVIGTLHLLESMLAEGVRRIVFISSGGTVYGIPRYVPLDEQHPTDPLVSYGITKLAIEKFILMYGRLHAIRPVILRVANPYGERQRVDNAQGAVAAFIHRALSGQAIEIWGDGSVSRDFLHVSDVADAFSCALAYSGRFSVFNISSGVGVTLNELVSRIETVMGRAVAREYRAARAFDVPISILKNDLARQELRWHPKVGIEEGIGRTLAWIAAQRKA